MARHYWTAREISVLKANYSTAGISGCIDLLPGRTRSSIYQHATVLGLRTSEKVRESWPASPQIDDQLRDLHSRALGRGDVVAFAQRIGRPVWWVSRRSRELGLITPRFRESPWNDDEIELLHDTAHLSLKVARAKFSAAGFTRSETAIQVKRKRIGTNPNNNGCYNANQIAELLGVDRKTVTRWIEEKELRAQARGELWLIRDKDLREFILAHPFRIMLRKIPAANTPWFIELIAGPRRQSILQGGRE